MIRLRLVGLAFIAVLALGAMVVSAAQAEPEFKPSTKQAFTGLSGASHLENTSGTTVECTHGKTTGEITGAHTVGTVVVKFTGCTAEKGKCSAKSKGAPASNEIIVNTLNGELGTTKEATSGVGLLLKPASGSTFVEIEASCTLISPAAVTGDIVGEATPTSKLSTTGKVVFTGSKGVAAIKSIAVLGKVEKAKLEAFGFESSETDTEEDTFTKAVEVT
jgi:hypothetical protein